MSVDPAVGLTRAPYGYAGENPLNFGDATGLSLAEVGEELLEETGNATAGAANTVTFGVSTDVLNAVGISPNTCSTGYQAGEIAALVGVLLVPGEGEAELGAEAGLIASDGTRITGFTRHGINRVIGDGASRAGVSPAALRDAITNGVKTAEGVDRLGRPFRVFTGTDARVVVNPETGKVISANPLSGAGANR